MSICQPLNEYGELTIMKNVLVIRIYQPRLIALRT